MDDRLDALEVFVAALEEAGDDPVALDAVAAPILAVTPGGGEGWTVEHRARASRIAARMAALDARLSARRAELSGALADLAASRPGPGARCFDAAL